SFFFQAEDGIRDFHVTGVQTCALPIYVYVSGCPPRPEALLYGLMRLQDKIRKEGTTLRKERVIMSGDTEPTLVVRERACPSSTCHQPSATSHASEVSQNGLPRRPAHRPAGHANVHDAAPVHVPV